MDISVIICTYNREAELRKTLEGFRKLQAPGGATWELLVVDNNSKDGTRAACESFVGILPIRYLHESRQGQNFAANRGVAEATGDLILLTDDDVDVDPAWATAILNAARKNDWASFFGGKVLSRWETEPPKWFSDNVNILRSNPRVDLGEASQRFSRGMEPRLIGANLAFRKSIFESGFTFSEDRGPRGDGKAGGQVGPAELDLEARIMDAGYEGLYVPEAVIHHRDPPWRMTERYVRHWYVQSGRLRVKAGEVPKGHEWFHAPRYLWREAVSSGLKFLGSRLAAPSHVWLSAECRMCTAWGSILQCREEARRR